MARNGLKRFGNCAKSVGDLSPMIAAQASLGEIAEGGVARSSGNRQGWNSASPLSSTKQEGCRWRSVRAHCRTPPRW
jgi:hypothetical protein